VSGNKQYGKARRERVLAELDAEKLRALALHYVGRYATTRAKLSAYLTRKCRERGWSGAMPLSENIVLIVAYCAEAGFVDDRAFADAKGRSATRKGLGIRRLSRDLLLAGIEAPDSTAALDDAGEGAEEAAENFARKKGIGRFAKLSGPIDQAARQKLRQKQINGFLRAGHSWEMAKLFIEQEPEE
jgi:regulatory protein